VRDEIAGTLLILAASRAWRWGNGVMTDGFVQGDGVQIGPDCNEIGIPAHSNCTIEAFLSGYMRNMVFTSRCCRNNLFIVFNWAALIPNRC